MCTAPVPAPINAQTFGVFGDLGDTANSSTVRDHLLAANPDFILNTGDFTYAGELPCLGLVRFSPNLRCCSFNSATPELAWKGGSVGGWTQRPCLPSLSMTLTP